MLHIFLAPQISASICQLLWLREIRHETYPFQVDRINAQPSTGRLAEVATFDDFPNPTRRTMATTLIYSTSHSTRIRRKFNPVTNRVMSTATNPATSHTVMNEEPSQIKRTNETITEVVLLEWGMGHQSNIIDVHFQMHFWNYSKGSNTSGLWTLNVLKYYLVSLNIPHPCCNISESTDNWLIFFTLLKSFLHSKFI